MSKIDTKNLNYNQIIEYSWKNEQFKQLGEFLKKNINSKNFEQILKNFDLNKLSSLTKIVKGGYTQKFYLNFFL